jgi:competence protein ComGC
VCVHNNKNNNFFFFFFFLLGRNYAQNSKLQQQQSFKTNTNQKPGKLKEERNSKPQSRYTLKTYTFFLLLLLLQNVNTNTHSNTYTHIKQNRNCSAKHVTRMLDKQWKQWNLRKEEEEMKLVQLTKGGDTKKKKKDSQGIGDITARCQRRKSQKIKKLKKKLHQINGDDACDTETQKGF